MTTKSFPCPHCAAVNTVLTPAPDRVALERQSGDYLHATCVHCYKPVRVHVNEIQARPDLVVTTIATCVALVAVALFWQLGFIAAAAFALPLVVYRAQQMAARSFNGYQLPRREPEADRLTRVVAPPPVV